MRVCTLSGVTSRVVNVIRERYLGAIQRRTDVCNVMYKKKKKKKKRRIHEKGSAKALREKERIGYDASEKKTGRGTEIAFCGRPPMPTRRGK